MRSRENQGNALLWSLRPLTNILQRYYKIKTLTVFCSVSRRAWSDCGTDISGRIGCICDSVWPACSQVLVPLLNISQPFLHIEHLRPSKIEERHLYRTNREWRREPATENVSLERFAIWTTWEICRYTRRIIGRVRGNQLESSSRLEWTIDIEPGFKDKTWHFTCLFRIVVS